ncbi:MAG: TlpA family protein disulfide reductase [Methylococcaceae bacterium]|nr:TlpA family protein disulfide reductase [Methylococcaceae bacterium]
MIIASLHQQSPLLSVSEWVQGTPVNIDQLSGKVVLVEIFQVNCPGCFLYSLPQAIHLHQQYAAQGMVVLGVATAFEDFDKNTLENLVRLVNGGEVVGETLNTLKQQGQLTNGCLPYRIAFPVAMDRLVKRQGDVTIEAIQTFIAAKLPDFNQYPADSQHKLQQHVRQYLEALDYHAETFERFQLQGTPSHILIDKQGVLRACEFGAYPNLEAQILTLLRE